MKIYNGCNQARPPILGANVRTLENWEQGRARPNAQAALLVQRLAAEEGGGWLVTFPDLPGCMSDGATPEEAMANGKEAVADWIKAARNRKASA